MPRRATYNYFGCTIAVTRVMAQVDGKGEPKPVYTLVITDPDEPAQHVMRFDEDVKEELVKQLTGGLVVPDGVAL